MELTRRLNRREMVVGGGTLLGGAAVARAAGQAAGGDKRTALHQEADLKGSPKRIYGIITDAKQFSACTGAPADIKSSEGGSFSLFGGQIVGRNIELVPDERIVQAWRPTDWKPGIYSIVKFELKPLGAKTRLILDHSSFPQGAYVELSEGWKAHYFDPLAKYLG